MTQHQHPWPSIANVSSLIDRHIDYALTSFNQAQLLIATAWRHRRLEPGHARHADATQLAQVMNGFRGRRLAGHLHSSRDFHAFFTSLPCVASQKFDGTNVGVTEDGLMLGRRMVIASNATSYCGTAVAAVKAALGKVEAVKRGLMLAPAAGAAADAAAEAAADYQRLHCTVYGELMCNGKRFDYAARGLSGAFTCFGVILRGTQQVCMTLERD
jgi:hypothetical protein